MRAITGTVFVVLSVAALLPPRLAAESKAVLDAGDFVSAESTGTVSEFVGQAMSDNVNTKPLTCACTTGRWWVVDPVFALCFALCFWLATQWPLAKEHVMYTLVPGICVFFTTAFLFRHASTNLELRSIGLSLLGVAIGVMAIHGAGLSVGLAAIQKTEKILAFAFYGSAAGLVWMAAYGSILAVKALRMSPNTRIHREQP